MTVMLSERLEIYCEAGISGCFEHFAARHMEDLRFVDLDLRYMYGTTVVDMLLQQTLS